MPRTSKRRMIPTAIKTFFMVNLAKKSFSRGQRVNQLFRRKSSYSLARGVTIIGQGSAMHRYFASWSIRSVRSKPDFRFNRSGGMAHR